MPTSNEKAAIPKNLDLLDRYWRAANYLSVGQIYLMDNPLLREQLRPAHIKPRLLGHWGTTPGLNFIYIPLNRILKEHNLDFTTSDAIDRVPSLGHRAAYAQQALRDKLIERKQYLAKHGGELPEIGSWKWSGK